MIHVTAARPSVRLWNSQPIIPATIKMVADKPVLLATLPECELDYDRKDELILKGINELFFRMKDMSCQAIVLDCREVKFIGSHGLGALIKLRKDLVESARVDQPYLLSIVAHNESMLKGIVEMCLMGRIPVEPCVEDALNRL